ncbi:universal stress protein [Nocardia sp. NBC_01329]|uniref:universal stress protein n=1 Tax=Nocardia sp. NBC_01329 TaxID=2903594 RepID=UPI002E125412|nr:universal stress protein [Nocardia sp. NBC_01329]
MAAHRTDHPRRLASAAVMVGTDGSEAAGRAVLWAAEAATRHRRELHIVHGLDLMAASSTLGLYDVTVPGVLENIRRRGADYVAAAAALARTVDPGLPIRTEVSEADPSRLLIQRSGTAHLVVLGASGQSSAFAHLGSTLLAVTAHGRGRVVVVRGNATDQGSHSALPVVVGVDGSRTGDAAVAAAFAEAAERATPLIAVHAWSDQRFDHLLGYPNAISNPDVAAAAQAVVAEQLAGWDEKYPDVDVVRKVYLSGPRHQLLEWSKVAQLVVVGSRGRGGFRGLLLGSTGNALVQHAHCPVMIAHTEHGAR